MNFDEKIDSEAIIQHKKKLKIYENNPKIFKFHTRFPMTSFQVKGPREKTIVTVPPELLTLIDCE